MEQKQMIVLIDEVAARLRVSTSTVRRWLAESRAGRGNLPRPVSVPGGKLRWLASDIEAYLASQSQATPPVVSTVRQVRRDQKEFHQRQAEADKILLRHRKPK